MSNKVKVLTEFGSRPETLKTAQLVHTLAADERLEERLV